MDLTWFQQQTAAEEAETRQQAWDKALVEQQKERELQHKLLQDEVIRMSQMDALHSSVAEEEEQREEIDVSLEENEQVE